MSWNIRVVQWTEGEEAYIGLREVYYTEGGLPYGHCEAVAVGNTRDELDQYMEWMEIAMTLPILYEADLNAVSTELH